MYQEHKCKVTFDEDWDSHARDFIDMAEDYEKLARDRAYFFRFGLNRDARQLYIHLLSTNATWNRILTAFNERYFSKIKRRSSTGGSRH